MKKYLCIVMVLATMGLVVPVNAGYYIAGDFNGWDAGGNEMTEIESGVWSVALSGISEGRHEFKVTDGTWSWNYPGPNSWLYADASGDITITFNTNIVSDGWQTEQYRLGLSTDNGLWTVAGSFNGWNNSDPATAMTSVGGGIYKLSVTLTAGTYYFKPIVTGTWDSIAADGRSVATSDMSVTTTTGMEVVNIYVDALGGVVRTEIVPEPATIMLLGVGLAGVLRSKRN